MQKSNTLKEVKELIKFYNFATKGEQREINRLLLSNNNISENQIKRISKLSLKYRKIKYRLDNQLQYRMSKIVRTSLTNDEEGKLKSTS